MTRKRGRPAGKARKTYLKESAIFAAYQRLRQQGKSHRAALSELAGESPGIDLQSILHTFEYKPYHSVPAFMTAGRIAQVVTQKNKVISDVRLQIEKKRAELYDQFRKSHNRGDDSE